MILSLLATWKLYPAPQRFEDEERESRVEGSFWLYSLFVFLSVVGFFSFPLLSYHMAKHVDLKVIPLLYALAMGVDAVSALISGKCYDRVGLKTLVFVPLLTPLVLFALLPHLPES